MAPGKAADGTVVGMWGAIQQLQRHRHAELGEQLLLVTRFHARDDLCGELVDVSKPGGRAVLLVQFDHVHEAVSRIRAAGSYSGAADLSGEAALRPPS